MRNCDYCQRKFFFNVSNSCTLCNFTICQREECKIKGESSLCSIQIETNLKSSPKLLTNKQKFFSNNGSNYLKNPFNSKNPKSGALKRKHFMLQNISEQILPVNQIANQLFPRYPRNRSMSNPEVILDNFKFQQAQHEVCLLNSLKRYITVNADVLACVPFSKMSHFLNFSSPMQMNFS